MRLFIDVSLLLLVIARASVVLSQGFSDEDDVGCQVGKTDAVMTNESFNDPPSSLLQIFTWMTSSCEGLVRSVTFYNQGTSTADKRFYLALLEPIMVTSHAFRIVNYVKISVDGTKAGWQRYDIPSNDGWKPPLLVEKKHVFGIFFDQWNGPSSSTVVPFRTVASDPSFTYLSYVAMMGLSEIRKYQEVNNGSDLTTQRTSRIPALIAKVSPLIDKSKSCGPLPTAPHARVEASSIMDTSTTGDYVVYGCDDGYTILANMFVVCQPDGIWTSPPFCTAVNATYCNPQLPPAIGNGVIKEVFYSDRIRNKTMPGDYVIYGCNYGYRLLGGQTGKVFCQRNRNWGPVPTCVEKQKARNCQPPKPGDVANADVKVVSYMEGSLPEPGDFVAYQCRDGFMFNSPADRIVWCQDSLGWSRLPICNAYCTEPTIEFGAIVLRSYPQGSVARTNDTFTIRCDSGYILSPNGSSPVQKCERSNWGVIPRCVALTCNDDPVITNAQVQQRSTAYGVLAKIGDVIKYQCNSGYGFAPNSPAMIRCEASGWSQLPRCIPLLCPEEPAPFDAQIVARTFAQGTRATKGDRLTYQCVNGSVFQPGFDGTIVCDGYDWSEMPICRVLVCPLEPVVDNAIVQARSYIVGTRPKFGDTVQYLCKAGYTFEVGSPSLVCCDGYSWGVIPKCTALYCPTCPGSKLTVSSVAGSYSIRRSCGDAPIPANGYTLYQDFSGSFSNINSRVFLACRDGYILTPTTQSLSICQEDGRWSARPSCSRTSPRRIGGNSSVQNFDDQHYQTGSYYQRQDIQVDWSSGKTVSSAKDLWIALLIISIIITSLFNVR